MIYGSSRIKVLLTLTMVPRFRLSGLTRQLLVASLLPRVRMEKLMTMVDLLDAHGDWIPPLPSAADPVVR